MEKAAVRWSRVVVSVVPAWPIGKATNSTRPQCFLRAAMRGEYFLVLFVASLVSQPSEIPGEADLDDDDGALLLVV